ncbi:MAG TPA: multicopper oxidase [Candidatus Acidoferrum sp.]|nr:multicopper oxidase [Candidatus Acidoferrum sp.]
MRWNKSAFSRREFLQTSGMALAGLAFGQSNPHKTGIIARPLLNLDALEKFVDPLPIPRIARPAGTRSFPERSGQKVPYYRLTMGQFQSKIHRDVGPTIFWGFDNSSPGPTIEARSGEPLFVEWVNDLPTKHMLPIDYNVHGAGRNAPDVRAVTHLHGAKVRPENDGYPEDWCTKGLSKKYFYPNEQDAAMLWYHDHALGITRLNMYAGLLGSYVIRDSFEDGLGLPRGKYEIPLVICDRFFDSHGQLYYPISPNPESPWIPELFGNSTLVNGKLFPYLEVEACKYRFRLLNGSNARFFYLSLSNGQQFQQIGTDLGLLPAPVPVKMLQIAPAERADLIVDFAEHRGETLVLMNTALPVMQFRVSKARAPESGLLSASLRPVQRIPESAAVRTRLLTLGEKDDPADNPEMMLLNNAHWDAPVTENPKLNSTEIWSLANFTDDTHPIHLHLVRFQVLDRRTFQPTDYYLRGKITYIGEAQRPAPNEMGWKDTVQAHPQMVTRIIARFEGFRGRYVWHCHVLEHEDNEMMRPYDVI